MKKLILSVVATSLIATSVFAETSKNGNTVINKLITCDNGAAGYETTISSLELSDVVVKYNSCNSRGIEVVDIRNVSTTANVVIFDTTDNTFFVENDSFETQKNGFNLSKFGLDSSKTYDIKNSEGEKIGDIREDRFFLYSQDDKDSDLYIEDKAYTVSMSEDNKKFTIKRK